MIILDATTKSLQMKLGAAVTSNQLPFAVSYINSSGTSTTPGEQDGASNNTTAVTIMSAPASSSQTLVKNIVIQNGDTASAKVTIIYNNNSTLRNIVVATLSAGDQLIYEDGNGWSSIDANGNLKTSGSGGGGAVSSVSNVDGTLTISPTTGSVVASLPSLTSANFLVGNGSNIATGVAMSGDATLANTGAITVTKTNGNAFATSATTDTTNAANISSGTLPSGRLGFAAKSDMQAATSSTLVVNPAQTQNHPGVAKAWINFTVSGTTVTTTASYNIGSITRSSAGTYVIDFSTNFASANYAIVCSPAQSTGSVPLFAAIESSPTSSSCTIIYTVYNNSALGDPVNASVVFYGSQ